MLMLMEKTLYKSMKCNGIVQSISLICFFLWKSYVPSLLNKLLLKNFFYRQLSKIIIITEVMLLYFLTRFNIYKVKSILFNLLPFQLHITISGEAKMCKWIHEHQVDWIHKAPALIGLGINLFFLIRIMWVSK